MRESLAPGRGADPDRHAVLFWRAFAGPAGKLPKSFFYFHAVAGNLPGKVLFLLAAHGSFP